MNIIKFYKVNDAYGVFSNFAPSLIVLEAEFWPTVEHYFQASKFEDMNIRDKIKNIASPMDAAIEGRNRDNKLRGDWEEVKEGKMLKALRAKFLQHPDLRNILLKTGDATIIEHTTNDSYWGDGGDGSGKNMLGSLLMRVRTELQEINDDPEVLLPPWLAFPNVDSMDMFWRMGYGEEYLTNHQKFIEQYGVQKYDTLFPTPTEWA